MTATQSKTSGCQQKKNFYRATSRLALDEFNDYEKDMQCFNELMPFANQTKIKASKLLKTQRSRLAFTVNASDNASFPEHVLTQNLYYVTLYVHNDSPRLMKSATRLSK